MTDYKAPPYNPSYPQQNAPYPPAPAPGEAPPAYSQQGCPQQGYPQGYPQHQYPPPGQAQYGYPQGYGPPPGQTGYPQQPGYAQVPQHQQHGYAPPAQPAVQVVQVGTMRFGESPVSMTCPHCSAAVITGTEYVSGTASWLACLACCGIGLVFGGITWFGCCLLPFCISACQDVEHRCPNCRKILGKMNRL